MCVCECYVCEMERGECIVHSMWSEGERQVSVSLEPRLSVPDSVSQLWRNFLQSCETESGTESLGSRLGQCMRSMQVWGHVYTTVCGYMYMVCVCALCVCGMCIYVCVCVGRGGGSMALGVSLPSLLTMLKYRAAPSAGL